LKQRHTTIRGQYGIVQIDVTSAPRPGIAISNTSVAEGAAATFTVTLDQRVLLLLSSICSEWFFTM
jgi:hypothetical protein